MSKRLATLRRILTVQQDLHRAAEWRLAALDRREAGLVQSQQDLVRFLGEDHAFTGLFANAMSGRMRSLAGEVAQTRQARAVEAENVLREAARAKRAERLTGALAAEERRAEERRSLVEIIEQAARVPDASPP